MATIMGTTNEEKFSSIQQILNQMQVREIGGVSAIELKDHNAALPADGIIFRHLLAKTGILQFSFYFGSLDTPNTTVEVTVTSSTGVASVTTHTSDVLVSGIQSLAVNNGDRVQIKLIIAGASPTDIWVTGVL